MFDVTLRAIGLDVVAPDEESLEAGAAPLLNFVVVAGQVLPFPDPQGNPITIPAAQVRFQVPKDASLDLAKVILEQAELLPDLKQSDLIVADNLQGVEKIAKQFDDFSKGPQG